MMRHRGEAAGRLGVVRKLRFQSPIRLAVRLALLSLPLAVVGEAGHQILGQMHATVAHHFFHLVFPLAAACIFAAWVAVDVHKHGWPAFSWRLGPPARRRRPT